MANAAGMLKESIWRDRDFRALPRTAQTTYAQLLSQKELDRAGVQPLQVSKWAKGCDEISDQDIDNDLKVLEERRFIFVDEESDELFVRSYMRQCEITRYPNILKNALRCAGLVASEKIRRELAAELRRLRRADANRVADLIDPDPPNPNGTQSNGSETLPETVRERLNGSGTPLKPPGMGTGTGTVPLGSSSVGEPPQKSQHDENQPPAAFCTKHPGGTTEPCRGCATAREAVTAWESRRQQTAENARRALLAEIDACPDCDSHGWALGEDGSPRDPATRCPNHDWSSRA